MIVWVPSCTLAGTFIDSVGDDAAADGADLIGRPGDSSVCIYDG